MPYKWAFYSNFCCFLKLENKKIHLSSHKNMYWKIQWCSKENQNDTIYEVNDLFLTWFLWYKNVIMLLSSWLKFTIDWSFKMRYSSNFYLNLYRNYERSNLKLSNFKFNNDFLERKVNIVSFNDILNIILFWNTLNDNILLSWVCRVLCKDDNHFTYCIWKFKS